MTEFPQLSFIYALAGSQFDEGRGYFAPLLVLHRHHGGLLDGRVAL